MYNEITKQTEIVVTEVLEQAKLKPGSLFVIGCSSSEMVGKRIERDPPWKLRRQHLKVSIRSFSAKGFILQYSAVNI